MSQTCSHSIIDPRGVRFRKIIGHQIKLQSLKEKSQRCCKAGTESTFHEHCHMICYNRSCPFDCSHNDQDWLLVWNICFFPYIGNNHPNWLIFFRGVGQPPTRRVFLFHTLLFSRWYAAHVVNAGFRPSPNAWTKGCIGLPGYINHLT